MADDLPAPLLVRPPGATAAAATPAAVAADVERWLDEAPFGLLVEAFGGEIPAESVAGRLDSLDRFSAEHWNPRGKGLERDQIGEFPLTPEQVALVLRTAGALGLTGSTRPASREYDHVLVLGGLARACLLRPRYTAELAGQGFGFGRVAALTAYRELSAGERDLIGRPEIDVQAENEAQMMSVGMQRAFGLPSEPDSIEEYVDANPFLNSGRQTWKTAQGQIEVIVAPTTRPKERANSADTYERWVELVEPAAGERVLLVTSSIYMPYQGAQAVRVLALGHGLLAETIGLDAYSPDFGVLQQQFTPGHYVQELRSAVLGAKALYEAAGAS